MKCSAASCREPGGYLVLRAPDGKGNHVGPGFVIEKVRTTRQTGYCISHARVMLHRQRQLEGRVS